MVRVTNYFDTQVRVPTVGDLGDQRLNAGKSAFLNHIHGSSTPSRKMSDEQIIGWYGKILDSVRLRYRKLQRYARCAIVAPCGSITG